MNCSQCGSVMQSKVIANRPYKRKLVRYTCGCCGHEQTESPTEREQEIIQEHYESLKKAEEKFYRANHVDGHSIHDT